MDSDEGQVHRSNIQFHMTSWERKVGEVVLAPHRQQRIFQVEKSDTCSIPPSSAWTASERQMFCSPRGAPSVHLNSEARQGSPVYAEGITRRMFYTDDWGNEMNKACRQPDEIFESAPRQRLYEGTISAGHSNDCAKALHHQSAHRVETPTLMNPYLHDEDFLVAPTRKPVPFCRRQSAFEIETPTAKQHAHHKETFISKQTIGDVPASLLQQAPENSSSLPRQRYHMSEFYILGNSLENIPVPRRQSSRERETMPARQSQYQDETGYLAAPPVYHSQSAINIDAPPAMQSARRDDTYIPGDFREDAPEIRHEVYGIKELPTRQRYQEDGTYMVAHSNKAPSVHLQQLSPERAAVLVHQRQYEDKTGSMRAQGKGFIPVHSRQQSPEREAVALQYNQFQDKRGYRGAQGKEAPPAYSQQSPDGEEVPRRQRQFQDKTGSTAAQGEGALPVHIRRQSPDEREAVPAHQRQYKDKTGYMDAQHKEALPAYNRQPSPEQQNVPAQQRKDAFASCPTTHDTASPVRKRFCDGPHHQKAVFYTNSDKLPAIGWYEESNAMAVKSPKKKRARAVLPMPQNSDEDEEAVDDPAPMKKRGQQKSRLTIKKRKEEEESDAPRPSLRRRPIKHSEAMTANQLFLNEDEGTSQDASVPSPNSDVIIIVDSEEEINYCEEAAQTVISNEESKPPQGQFRAAAIASYLQDWECFHCNHPMDEFRPAGILKSCKPHIDLIHFECLLECVSRFSRCPQCNVAAKVEDLQ